MGIAFSIVGVAMLVGTPIEGALLGNAFKWWKAIVFCGVGSFLPDIQANIHVNWTR
jgi:hypothetical protein